MFLHYKEADTQDDLITEVIPDDPDHQKLQFDNVDGRVKAAHPVDFPITD